ncbi:uncharacterized protein OCT59_015991 [Rhizophagus irregularis]|uniref:uncharacterized protein n=1 Tax=Rhizophagus irregularis TaxID=588596 RepID=UPI000CB5750D|nr:hypothetical protein OCT59_015991 [Rhizophagus irregularis]GBC30864.1 hypothetical protein GLOIN_2v1842636 [Rhizophagus irregularis DAOM 181602=DAOM 197198]
MIVHKINLTEEELGKYLRGEEQIKIEIHDKNEVIIEKKILAKKTTNNGGKRKSCGVCEENAEIKKRKKEDKVEKFIKEVSTPIKGNERMTLESQFTGIDNQNEEINDIENLVEKYLDLGDINSRAIQKWYFLGRDFERKVEEMKNQGRKKKSEQTARRDLYNEMMGLLVKGDEDAEEKLRVRGALKERMQGAVKIYELFIEIRQDKINRIKETFVTTIIKFTESEKKEIIGHFRN